MGKSRRYLGSSDSPPIVGVRSYGRTELDVWESKVLELPPRPPTALQRWGLIHEPAILRVYGEDTGRTVERRRRRHYIEGKPYIGATVDALADGRIVEAKFSPWSFDWGEPEDGPEGLPRYVWVQVQHQLMVTGLEVADVPVLVRGYDLRTFEVPREDAFVRDLEDELTDWWHTYVVPKVPPVPSEYEDSDLPAIRRRYPQDDGSTLLATAEQRPVLEAYRVARLQRLDATKREKAAKAAIADAMGSASLLVGDGVRITYRNTRPREVVSWPDVASAYRGALESLRVPCATCGGDGWVARTTADPLPSGEPYQVQDTCPECGGSGQDTGALYAALDAIPDLDAIESLYTRSVTSRPMHPKFDDERLDALEATTAGTQEDPDAE